MNTDIRVTTTFRGSRKRKKLAMKWGKDPAGHLIDLWIGTAESRPDGILAGWNETDIALEAGWEDDPGQFVKDLVEAGFLDKRQDGDYIIHDWQDHNAWASDAERRSKAAKKAARARWNKRNGCKPDAEEDKPNKGNNAEAMRPHADRIKAQCGEQGRGNAPSPYPSPSPNPPKKDYCPEPVPDSEPNKDQSLVLSFPLNDKTEFSVTRAMVDEWSELYPGIDVLQSLRNCLGWNKANPKNRKTRRGINKHINSWLARDQDKARPDRGNQSSDISAYKPHIASDAELQEMVS